MSAEKQEKGMDLSGVGDLAGLLNDSETEETRLLKLDINLINEDPENPRTDENPGFSKKSIGELAATIIERGVKTPISVRNNPEQKGRFIINHGARRFRASKEANKSTIPAFLDNDYNNTDQIIENIQRNELTCREIADYIGRELAKGVKKGVIAKNIGKSGSFVTQHITLLNLPSIIGVAYNQGRVSDVTVINEIVKAYKKNPDDVVAWLNDEDQELTRGGVKLLREFLDDKNTSVESNDDYEVVDNNKEDEEKIISKKDSTKSSSKLKKSIVVVTHNNRRGQLLTNLRPPEEGFGWLKYDDSGDKKAVDLTTVQLTSIIESD